MRIRPFEIESRMRSVRARRRPLSLVAVVALWLTPVLLADSSHRLGWRQLPPLPDPCGFASPFVGVAGPVLIVAGGANFPDQQLWEGGRKTWHERVFALKPGAEQWEMAGKLPQLLGYGVSVAFDNGVLCIGGGNAERHSADAFVLQWKSDRLAFRSFPALPKPVAMAAGARVGNIVYVAGGLETPDSKASMKTFFAFDLEQPAAGWRELPSWPGPGRSQAVAAAVGKEFYLFSGLLHQLQPDGTAKLVYLNDAYRYAPAAGWQKLADIPYPAIAAASPAPVARGEVLLVGGVDGMLVGKAPQEFLSVPQRIQAYSPATRAWRDAGNAPAGRVCVTTTEWNGRWILPSGERSAGVRSPEVWALQSAAPQK
jgi:N-acetylneuraminic acid mutarotase